MKIKVEMQSDGKMKMTVISMLRGDTTSDIEATFAPAELQKFIELLSLADRSRTFKQGELTVRG